jgi:hypothetical protein
MSLERRSLRVEWSDTVVTLRMTAVYGDGVTGPAA